MANLFIGMVGSGVKTMMALQAQIKSYNPIAFGKIFKVLNNKL